MSLKSESYRNMSFSSDVKTELCAIENTQDCCRRAEAYGLLFFGHIFGKYEISLTTEYDFVAEKYKQAIACFIHTEPAVSVSRSGKITVSVESADDRIDILNELGYTGKETSLRLLKTNIENECCFGAFLRGAFLSCGIITDPKREYHLEFDPAFKNKCRDLCEFLDGFAVSPKISDRNGVNIVYFKDSSQIEDILTVMGAQMSVLSLINEKIFKDVRNHVNRKVNCDNANIRKTCKAASQHIKAIESLMASGKFEELDGEIKELAMLRLDNPEMTLNELGENLSKPLSRSGVNHRLKKLMESAQKDIMNS